LFQYRLEFSKSKYHLPYAEYVDFIKTKGYPGFVITLSKHNVINPGDILTVNRSKIMLEIIIDKITKPEI
jgi:hypothetical protein